MKRLFLILLGLCLPILAFAQAALPTEVISGAVFNPPAIQNGTDLSISYLGDMFGVVDGVLHGSGSQIMGQMFMIFNAGALLLGGIIVIYTSLISLMNTAHEGEVMGKKWSSIWIPLRTVGGIALLIPKATGYCAIQIFMMWVIVQGVGLADTIWNQATNYLAAGGVIVQQSLEPQSSFGSTAQNLFLQSICLASLQSMYNTAYQSASQTNSNLPVVPNFLESVNPLQPGNCASTSNNPGGWCTAQLPSFPNQVTNGYNWSQLNGACGVVQWQQLSPQASANAGTNQALQQAYAQALQVGIQQMLLDMSGPAQAVVDNTLLPPSGVTPNTDVSSYLNSQMFLNAAEDYEGIVYPASRETTQNMVSNVLQQYITSGQASGWINAGAYYQIMASANSAVSGASFTGNQPTASNANDISNSLAIVDTKGPPGMSINTDPLTTMLKAAAVNNSTATPPVVNVNGFLSIAPTSSSTYGDTVGGSASGWKNILSQAAGGTSGASSLINSVANPLLGPLLTDFQGFVGLIESQSTNANPVVLISMLGSSLMELVVTVWVAGAVTLGIATGALSAVPCEALGNIMIVVTEWIVPFLWGICGLLFVEGAIMEFYIPLIPYMLFLFGAIGWLIATLEAMVAAPLVALGITHPEGQEVLGKADPAVLLLVNVFLRPSLMIIGFIGGIILSYVSVWLLNRGFFQSFVIAAFANTSGAAVLFGIPVMIILYVGIVIALLNYSFQLINVVPDKVMRWIGGQQEGVAGEAGRMLGETKQGLSEGMKGIGQGLQDLAKASGSKKEKEDKGKAKVKTSDETNVAGQ